MKEILALSISIVAIYIATSTETGMAFANDSTAPTLAPEPLAESPTPTQDFSPSASAADSPVPDFSPSSSSGEAPAPDYYSPEAGSADSPAPDYSPAAGSAESPAPDSSLPGCYDVTHYGAVADMEREEGAL